MELEKIHNCPESKGKIVCISMDDFGNTFCGYCHRQVNYKLYYDKAYKHRMSEFINNNPKRREYTWQKKKRKKDK